MKNAGIIAAVVASIVLNIVCLLQISQLKNSNKSLSSTIDRLYKDGAPKSSERHGDHDDDDHHEEEEELEISSIMTTIQRHFGKLYFAGTAQNWELAEFYTHEVEEAMEELKEHHIVEDGINISQFMKIMGLTPLENLDEAVDKKDLTEFKAAYTAQIAQCNACHAATKHPYIRIKEPERPVFSNQIFTPIGN